MTQPRNFIMSSDYPIPILALKLSTTINVPVGQYWNENKKIVPHNLPFTPLIIGQWSTNANFNPAFDLSTQIPIFYGSSQPPFVVNIGADDHNIYINCSHSNSFETVFYFRLTGFVPPDYEGEVDNVDDITNFRLNSDFNYPKILEQRKITVEANTDSIINHNLGYIPQARLWKIGQVGNYSQGHHNCVMPQATTRSTNNDGYLGALINDKQYIICNKSNSSSQETFYYHIYGDEI